MSVVKIGVRRNHSKLLFQDGLSQKTDRHRVDVELQKRHRKCVAMNEDTKSTYSDLDRRLRRADKTLWVWLGNIQRRNEPVTTHDSA